MIRKYCRSCRLADPRRNVCSLSGVRIDLDADFCSKHKNDFADCDVCGSPTLQQFLYKNSNHELITVCADCVGKVNGCAGCQNGIHCDFEENPSPLPKTVQKQFRQRNMITVTTVMNPERVLITCKNGCKCFNEENGCMRQFNYCEKGEYIYGDLSINSEVHSEV